MRSSERETLARHILKASSADATSVLVSTRDAALARFSRAAIHQHVAGKDTSVSVRAVIGKRSGVAGTNRLDDTSLASLVRRATDLARFAPEDPRLAPLPCGSPTSAPQGSYVAATAQADPRLRTQALEAIFSVAEERGQWCAGFAATGSSGYTVANDAGALASFDGTDAAINVKMNATDSTGFAEGYSTDIHGLDGRQIAERAATKATQTAAPRSVDPGVWTVILEPAALGELLVYLAGHFSAQTYDEGASFFSGALGTFQLDERLTIQDDYAHPLNPGMPFDFEGQPTQRLALVDHGTVSNIVTDSYWAQRLARENTGHALPAPNAWGPHARHMVVAVGTQTTDELIAQTERGLLVSRFWYIRTVDRKRAIVTGMTRDGTYLIENGKLAGGVRNLRFNQSIVDALRSCEFSSEQQRTGGYSYSCVVPSAKLQQFRFTSTTEF